MRKQWGEESVYVCFVCLCRSRVCGQTCCKGTFEKSTWHCCYSSLSPRSPPNRPRVNDPQPHLLLLRVTPPPVSPVFCPLAPLLSAQGILLVFDVTDRESFDHIEGWITQIEKHADVAVNKVLIGNKVDKSPDMIVR